MTNKAIISIGSNKDRTNNINSVTQLLQSSYPGSRFSTPEITEPIDLPEGTKPFLNLVAMIPTSESCEDFCSRLKAIEKDFGRDPDDDEEGIIPLDIDLIEWNDEVIRPHDLVRPYVVAGMEEIDEF